MLFSFVYCCNEFLCGTVKLIKLFEVLLYVHRNRRLIRDWIPGRPPGLSHSSLLVLCIVLCCVVSCCVVLCCILLNCIVMHFAALFYCTVLYCIFVFILNCTVLHCIVLHYILLYCIILYCIRNMNISRTRYGSRESRIVASTASASGSAEVQTDSAD